MNEGSILAISPIDFAALSFWEVAVRRHEDRFQLLSYSLVLCNCTAIARWQLHKLDQFAETDGIQHVSKSRSCNS